MVAVSYSLYVLTNSLRHKTLVVLKTSLVQMSRNVFNRLPSSPPGCYKISCLLQDRYVNNCRVVQFGQNMPRVIITVVLSLPSNLSAQQIIQQTEFFDIHDSVDTLYLLVHFDGLVGGGYDNRS